MMGGQVVLATLTYKDGEWFLVPAKGGLVEVTEDVDVWAIIRSLVRLEV
jgi:DNA polymerase V